MKIKILIASILTLSLALANLCSASSTNSAPEINLSMTEAEIQESLRENFKRYKTISQPYKGELIILLQKAVTLHKKKIDVPLENYWVGIFDEGKTIRIVFANYRKSPLIRGSLEDVPDFHVVADKKTYKIIKHGIPK